MRTPSGIIIFGIIILFTCALSFENETGKGKSSNRGEIGIYKNKFIWTGTNQVFVPNLIMLDALTSNAISGEKEKITELNFTFQTGNKNDLSVVTEENLDIFIEEFMHGHGFNGIHVPVFGQWFHIGDNKVTVNDSVPDPRTFEILKLIIKKVYQAGGVTYLWVWGDHQRQWTSKSTEDGIMGRQEKKVMDMIAEKLGPLNGWFMGYGFDLFEWISEENLKEWHDYMWAKEGWNKLLGARSATNKLNQFYEGLDFSDYEFHKPWYNTLVKMINARPEKPSLSGDRYRIRRNPPSKWPEKDYNEEETRRGLWHHTMAGGIGAIWGNLDFNGIYANKEELKCFSVFWNDKNRFRNDMIPDNTLSTGYCLREEDKYYVFYQENTDELNYRFSGKRKKVIAVDTRKPYQEIEIGKLKAGDHVFEAPYRSDWALAIE